MEDNKELCHRFLFFFFETDFSSENNFNGELNLLSNQNTVIFLDKT